MAHGLCVTVLWGDRDSVETSASPTSQESAAASDGNQTHFWETERLLQHSHGSKSQ